VNDLIEDLYNALVTAKAIDVTVSEIENINYSTFLENEEEKKDLNK
jgi:hypothetical protein